MPRPLFGPLEVITGVASLTIAGWLLACAKGRVVPATAIFGSLVGLAYLKAPSRSYPTAEEVTEKVDLTGKVAVVTGATSGIGIETARVLALRGAHVYLAARNPNKLQATQKELLAGLPDSAKISIVTCDLGDLQSVKHCAKTLLADHKAIHICINNAGIMAVPERRATAQGLEQQVGVCHVGHFYLVKLLLRALKRGQARVVCLSSSAHAYHDMADCLKSNKLETTPYDEWTAYGNAKCANILHAKALNDIPEISAYSVMPGGIHTGLQEHVGIVTRIQWSLVTPFFFKSIPQGAATTLVCATSDNAQAGEYHDNCKSAPKVLGKVLETVGSNAARELWQATESLLKDLGFD